jgi:hypothetical protein
MKPLVLSHTIYALYWNKKLQLRTANEDVIRLFLIQARKRGEKLASYHINSNVSAGYDIPAFLEGKELPLCWQVA